MNAPRLNPNQRCRYSIYLPRRDGRLSWPVSLIAAPPGVEPATTNTWSQVRRPNRYATKPPSMRGFQSWVSKHSRWGRRVTTEKVAYRHVMTYRRATRLRELISGGVDGAWASSRSEPPRSPTSLPAAGSVLCVHDAPAMKLWRNRRRKTQ